MCRRDAWLNARPCTRSWRTFTRRLSAHIYYDFSSFLRPYLLGYSPKTYLKTPKNQLCAPRRLPFSSRLTCPGCPVEHCCLIGRPFGQAAFTPARCQRLTLNMRPVKRWPTSCARQGCINSGPIKPCCPLDPRPLQALSRKRLDHRRPRQHALQIRPELRPISGGFGRKVARPSAEHQCVDVDG